MLFTKFPKRRLHQRQSKQTAEATGKMQLPEARMKAKRMLRLLALGLLAAGLCPAILCHPSGTPAPENLTQEDQDHTRPADELLASSSLDFAFSLYRQLVRQTPGENVIFSPLSTSMALAFLLLGAHGNTHTEILEGLKLNITEMSEAEVHLSFQRLLRTLNQPSDQLQLSTGNAMFVQQQLQLLDKFVEDAKELYTAEAFLTDFQDTATAEKAINDYVKKETQGKITELVKNLNPETMLVLVNYIFFKAKWKTPFDPRDTFESRFYVRKNKWVKVPMMKLEDLSTPFFRDEELSCTVVELPYTGNASMLFVLPDKGKMEEVEARLLPETLRRWRDSLQTRWVDELYLPKFSISGNYNLNDMLSQMGIRDVFTSNADLSGVTGTKDLVLSQVVHKAVLDVAEVGTEAAAATGVKISPMSGKIGPLTIVNFNRPFQIILLDSGTTSILFLGKVANPKHV
ncbi:alpha-1-antichymotrypsin [Carlito syrichta]|uniref:Alpha-1-antichymotrypsin n=1 Tax=Carlito syrichta TaxID=1868482 RepID=A0A1U7U7J9_CARSF|nr:alpha-1-antichymotrypsin [Carlito syrichta]